jgi:hypothetical protein
MPDAATVLCRADIAKNGGVSQILWEIEVRILGTTEWWRRGSDSNPRYRCVSPYNGLANESFSPPSLVFKGLQSDSGVLAGSG